MPRKKITSKILVRAPWLLTTFFGGLLSAGLSFALVIQAITNMCVVVGLLPVTGVTLPLISMGGTSQLFTGITLGIILSVSRQNNLETSYV